MISRLRREFKSATTRFPFKIAGDPGVLAFIESLSIGIYALMFSAINLLMNKMYLSYGQIAMP